MAHPLAKVRLPEHLLEMVVGFTQIVKPARAPQGYLPSVIFNRRPNKPFHILEYNFAYGLHSCEN